MATSAIGYTEFDVAGRKTSVTDRNGRTREFIHDDANRLTGEIWYDENWAVVNVVTYGYDNANRLTSAGDSIGGTYGLGYDDANRLASKQTPLGLTLNFGYDNANRRTSLTRFAGRRGRGEQIGRSALL